MFVPDRLFPPCLKFVGKARRLRKSGAPQRSFPWLDSGLAHRQTGDALAHKNMNIRKSCLRKKGFGPRTSKLNVYDVTNLISLAFHFEMSLPKFSILRVGSYP